MTTKTCIYYLAGLANSNIDISTTENILLNLTKIIHNIKAGIYKRVPAQITYELLFSKRPKVKNLYDIFRTFEYKTNEYGTITHYIRYDNVRIKHDWVYVYFQEGDNNEEDEDEDFH